MTLTIISCNIIFQTVDLKFQTLKLAWNQHVTQTTDTVILLVILGVKH